MPYALIPEGFELKKVTKLQERAVDEYFGRQRRGTYISEILSNPTGPPILGAIIGLASAPTILGLIFDALTKQDVTVNGKDDINYATFTKDFAEAFFEIATPTGGITFEGEAKDFWDKYVKR